MGFPKLLIEGKPRRIEELQMNVQKKLNCVNRKLNIAITKIANAYRHPNILAEFIARQLKNRVSFRKTIKKAIELIEKVGAKGVQVQIAGRIDRKEIARVEWIREGKVSILFNDLAKVTCLGSHKIISRFVKYILGTWGVF